MIAETGAITRTINFPARHADTIPDYIQKRRLLALQRRNNRLNTRRNEPTNLEWAQSDKGQRDLIFLAYAASSLAIPLSRSQLA